MLLNSAYNTSAYTTEHPSAYNTVDTLLDDVSLQMASSNLSRRASQKGSRTGSMRVVKTASASNSPRNSSGLLRRRTVMTDNHYRRHPLMVDQTGVRQVDIGGLYEGLSTTSRTSRPVSWHPGSEMAPEASQTTYLVPRFQLDEHFRPYELPPTPAIFSGYASPASAFSPSTQPFMAYEHDQFPFFQDTTSMQPANFDLMDNLYPQYPPSTHQTDDLSTTMDNGMSSSMYPQFDWNNFAVNGFNNTTAPPTPENLFPIQNPTPSLEAEESIPYHGLEDSEPTGEILVGMGLYDTPEKSNQSDPQLEKYRSLLMTQLLGPAQRKPEATGKGLKLEETWAPASDDGEEDDDDDGGDEEEDDDEDADGSSAEDNTEVVSGRTTNQDIPEYTPDFPNKGNLAPNYLSGHYPDVQYGGAGWL